MIPAPGSARWVAQQPGYLAPEPLGVVVVVIPDDVLDTLALALDPSPLRSLERDLDILDQLEALGIFFG